MIPDQSVATVIQQLAEKLGTSAGQMWPYLVRYTQIVHAVGFGLYIFWVVVALAGAAWGAWWCRWGFSLIGTPGGYRDDKLTISDEAVMGRLGFGILLMGGGLCAAAALLAGSTGELAGVLVPEARAVVDIIQLLTAKR